MKKKLFYLVGLMFFSVLGYSDEIIKIDVEGNAKVESEAIVGILSSKAGDLLDESKIKNDVLSLYELGYFSEVRFLKEANGSGKIILVVSVKEKPAITSITYSGLEEVTEEDFEKQLETKIYTILNESSLSKDARLIEKKYEEKGFYLAKVNYELKPKGDNEVEVIFKVDEGGKVLVGDIDILGNQYFSHSDLISNFVLKPHTRQSSYGSSSIFQKDRLTRDTEFLAYFYRDNGFAQIKVAKPIVQFDLDRKFARVTFQVEEGIQFRVGSIEISGDIGEGLYFPEDLVPKMQLAPNKIFKYSHFSSDVGFIVDKYGDLGYAFVDVNPLTRFDSDKKLVHINYKITKGQKVYFGQMNIVGNVKTRDNVIRREMEVSDSELFSGTRLSESKKNITRLGFFEEVAIVRERDEELSDVMNLKIKVKEKPTGQLQAAIGYSPGGETSGGGFGHGKYEERNQSGKGWTTSIAAKYSSLENYQIDTGFTDPRVNDSHWSLGLNYAYIVQLTRYGELEVPEERRNVSVTVGRKLFELVRGYISLRHSRIRQKDEIFLFDGFESRGMKNSIVFGVSRRSLDNFLDPTEGTSINIRQGFSGGILGGDFKFMETLVDGEYYIPFPFTDEYKTYLKIKGVFGKLWRQGGEEIPSIERYRLGGFQNLRGYGNWDIGPKERRGRSPLGGSYIHPKGGDRKLYFQTEYFLPLIPQAGIKFLLFADAGRVYDEPDHFGLEGFAYDFGFGFRWITPIAPFRFEWATPYYSEENRFGPMRFIFNIGY